MLAIRGPMDLTVCVTFVSFQYEAASARPRPPLACFVYGARAIYHPHPQPELPIIK